MKISDYQKHCFKNYKSSIGYPEHYHYIYGTPINILVPIETVQNKIMIEVSDSDAKSYLNGKARQKDINHHTRNFICLPHPGILMKRTDRNPWPEKFEKELAITTSNEIKKIRDAWH